ncbi:MAG: nucleotide sugar dehydrogenase [Candidatus Omnitrophica bacterium]|nr:nucleotide sugar dehydrogenase [Candidatus Omnitrophota bacterium]
MSRVAEILAKKISSKKARIAIIGQGYVGLPLANAFASHGFRVTGIDLDARKISMIQKGVSYIEDISSASLTKLVKQKRLFASCSYEPLRDSDVVIVCVPTPLNRAKDPDISFIVSATEAILQHLHPGQLIILESTTYPGTTEEVILPTLEKSRLKVGHDFFLCFSPERIDPGNPNFHTQNIPKVVGGVTPQCAKLAASLYEKITTSVLKVSSCRTAEMSKLLENTFRIVNIGLINELARAASSLKVNIWEVIEAAKTKPFGFMPFYPGPGIGGHCIGVDPIYLSWKAKISGFDLHFIELARRLNSEMPHHVVSQAVYTLNQYAHKAISRSKVMLLGVSYKKDVSDIRESPALDILQALQGLGAKIAYHDPYVPQIQNDSLSLKSSPLSPKILKEQDLVILTTDHTCFAYRSIVKHAHLIYDTRNALKHFKEPHIMRL